VIQAIPVILCGGAGTRLWPLSRAGFPKQFLVLWGAYSLFQSAVKRLNALADDEIEMGPSLVVTGEEHRFLGLEQFREVQAGPASFVLEPSSRNTAAALTLAAMKAVSQGEDPVLVASPADQYIGDEAGYTTSLRLAIHAASNGKIVILGVSPDRPEPGYGYIQSSLNVNHAAEHVVYRFVEKPSLDMAQRYLDSGEYVWNSGMFVMKASVWLEALAHFRPDILQACEIAYADSTNDPLNGDIEFVRPNAHAFARVPSVSIDYAVMEKCPGSMFPISMVSLNALWSDLGAWDAIWQVGHPDMHGNVVQGDVLLDSSENNFVHSSSRLVGLVGVKDLAVIETADAVLVCQKTSSQNVKNIVAHLQNSGRSEQNLHRKVQRPWGWYDSLDEGEGFKVHRICVKPGQSFSLQKHAHRAEHWIVVKGRAKVTRGSAEFFLNENESTYIPIGEVHQLHNVSAIDLEVIEVQSGAYLGEDDIVRLHEKYGSERA
jgi:mannose-1-phosphate guanylyltransferase / mannose-6-phosphate isomerase